MREIYLRVRYALRPEKLVVRLVGEDIRRRRENGDLAASWVSGFTEGLATSVAAGKIPDGARNRAQNILTALRHPATVSNDVELKQILSSADPATMEDWVRKEQDARGGGRFATQDPDDMASDPATW